MFNVAWQRSGDKTLMPLSAIYPRELGLAMLRVMQWLRFGTSVLSMSNFADEFSDYLPDPMDSLDLAREDAARVGFDDRDIGWPEMKRELPPRVSQGSKRVLLKKRKMMKEASAGPIEVLDTEQDESGSEGQEADMQPLRHTRSQEYGVSLSHWLLNNTQCGVRCKR